MPHQNPLKLFQAGMLAAIVNAGFAPLLHAADTRAESQPAAAQPDVSQPQQQAAPAHPKSETEPLDGDETELV